MITFKQLKRNLKRDISALPTLKVSLLGDVWHTYYDSCDKRQLAQMYESINYLKEKHPSIKYMDYFQDSRFLEDDFYDPCHLTDCGAVKFTKLLDSIIE